MRAISAIQQTSGISEADIGSGRISGLRCADFVEKLPGGAPSIAQHRSTKNMFLSSTIRCHDHNVSLAARQQDFLWQAPVVVLLRTGPEFFNKIRHEPTLG
ncbi:hypothetical protein [Methylobacterium sp. CCH5-D2]|uniref:hypothetical protein n=1 Tax=Methylobacterium sp. CCH5-D2 TaxID=1768765 RepID=UPI0012E3425C|nr:hypothetical protein [Methylobacterium sp. CCH5-D2]